MLGRRRSPEQGYSCGPNAKVWIHKWFRDCVYTRWETVAFSIGLFSVLFGLVAQCPQIVTNYLRQSADALSPWFLLQWLAADTCNLLGCLLTGDQLATETVTAYYSVFADCLIISQYTYYQIRNGNKPLGSYDCNSDYSLQKPSFRYQDVVKGFSEHAAAKLDKATHFEGTPKEFSRRSSTGNHDWFFVPAIQSSCKLSATLLPEKWAGRRLCQDDISHVVPLEAEIQQHVLCKIPNLANWYSSHSAVIFQLEQAIRSETHSLGKAHQFQIVDVGHFLHPQIDSKQECPLMLEEHHRLRRILLKYVPKIKKACVGIKLGHRKHEGCVGVKLGHRKLPLSMRKARVRAVLCLASVLIIGSSSWHSLLTFHVRDLDANYGFILGRRSLKSYLEERKMAPLWIYYAGYIISDFLFRDTSLTAFTGRKLLSRGISLFWWTEQLGLLMGWISSVLSLGSRISQLIKNKQRMSAEGLSLGMVTCSVLADLAYGLSVFMRTSSWKDFMKKAPWLAGSMGAIILDFTLFLQVQYLNWCYKKGKLNEHTPLLAS